MCVREKRISLFFCIFLSDFQWLFPLSKFFLDGLPLFSYKRFFTIYKRNNFLFLLIAWSRSNLVSEQFFFYLGPFIFLLCFLSYFLFIFHFFYFFIFWFLKKKKSNVNVNSMRRIYQRFWIVVLIIKRTETKFWIWYSFEKMLKMVQMHQKYIFLVL